MGVWIEIESIKEFGFTQPSLPAWECGLKSNPTSKQSGLFVSLPAWECGLKSGFWRYMVDGSPVTPCVGVWIEMDYRQVIRVTNKSHSLRGSVD